MRACAEVVNVCVSACVCVFINTFTLSFLSGPLTFKTVSVLMLLVAHLLSDNERWLHAMCAAVKAPNRCPFVWPPSAAGCLHSFILNCCSHSILLRSLPPSAAARCCHKALPKLHIT